MGFAEEWGKWKDREGERNERVFGWGIGMLEHETLEVERSR